MSILQIACAADARYLPHSAAMLRSVLTVERGKPVHVHYLHGPTLPPERARRLATMVEAQGGTISFLQIEDEQVRGLPEWGRIPTTMWYRILLPELLPDVERLLYLDIDTIAVDTLEPLWAMDMSDSYIGAVTNVLERHETGRPAKLGLETSDYFNSGMLLMNLELMRRDGCTQALREYALAHREQLKWPDQDTLNVVLGGRRLALHPRWNLMNSIRLFDWSEELFGAAVVAEARANPAIVHFEGPSVNKPWHLLCDHPLRDVYFEHRRATPWPRCRREGVTPLNLVRLARRSVSDRGQSGAHKARNSMLDG